MQKDKHINRQTSRQREIDKGGNQAERQTKRQTCRQQAVRLDR